MEEPIFKPDDIVEFQGLVKAKDDNGKQGVILGYDSKKKRYEVAVKWATEPKKLKAENLKKVEPPKAPEPPQPQRPSPPKQRTNSRSRSTTKPKEGKKRSRSKSGKNGERARTEKSPEKETKKRAASKGRRSRSRKSRRRSRSRKSQRRSRSRKSRRRSRSRKSRRRSRSRSQRRRSPSDKKRARHEAAPAQSGREGVAPASMPAALASNLAPMRTEQKGKGGGKGNKGRNFQISKALARILRHTAQSLGLQIRADGFCQLQDILALNEFTTMGATAEDVQVAVQSNDKKRFETKIEADKVLIRAVQGHSMKTVDDNSLLKRLNADDPNLPKVCVHGTYRRNVDSIQRNGLLVGGGVSQRNHVHFAPYEPHDGRVISGMRYNCEVAIYIDLPTAIRDGVPFFQSANEVILSPGINGTVPAKYISKVRDLSGSQ